MMPAVYFTTLGLILGTTALIFGMKYWSAASAARARLANDGAYRSLAEKAVATEAENQALLAAIRTELSGVTASLGAVEAILKQVG